MVSSLKTYWSVCKAALTNYNRDKIPRLSASLAYCTVFSMSPLFVIAVAVAGMWFGSGGARQRLFAQLNEMLGPQGAKAAEAILASAQQPATSVLATVVATVTLVIGATGVFVELQDALNTIWNVQLKAGAGLNGFLRDRLLTFAMVAGIGFLLLVSMLLTTAIAAFGKFLATEMA
ncbi:MAG TPA: YihY/virulence factor BrkB family protein, partial [Verrucomicrobiae bacterium]